MPHGPQPPHQQSRQRVLTDTTDATGRCWRAISVSSEGELVIEGHDLGRDVERVFGGREYEFQRRYSPDDVTTLREVLGLDVAEDLLTALVARWESTAEIEQFLAGLGLRGRFSSRSGD